MSRTMLYLLLLLLIQACQRSVEDHSDNAKQGPEIVLTLEQANRLAQLPLACMETEYPNRLGQTLGGPQDLATPKELHPAFYGCFDWHSAVHGHWSLVRLLKEFPELDEADAIRTRLQRNISPDHIRTELKYLDGVHNKTFERTYGWAWLLKLQQELITWDDPLGMELRTNLQPLSDTIVARFMTFLPKLDHAIRVGEHSNTAFGLCFAWDYAAEVGDTAFQQAIRSKALQLFARDRDCPLEWEPSGFDFLSPCLEEADLMHRVLPSEEFHRWLSAFLPTLEGGGHGLQAVTVSDRKDGRLVHLDGLNFSRAWVLWSLAKDQRYAHLDTLADAHFLHAYPNLFGDSYEGGHWLASFALYALDRKNNE